MTSDRYLMFDGECLRQWPFALARPLAASAHFLAGRSSLSDGRPQQSYISECRDKTALAKQFFVSITVVIYIEDYIEGKFDFRGPRLDNIAHMKVLLFEKFKLLQFQFVRSVLDVDLKFRN